MDLSSDKLQDLIDNPDFILVSDTMLFVRLLVGGEASLYYIKDRNEKNHFWIQKGGEEIIELRVEKKLVTRSRKYANAAYGSRGVAENMIFRLILSGVMNDCPEMEEEIERTELTNKSLIKLVSKYNECIHPESTIYITQSKKLKVKFGILAGAGIQWYKTNGSDFVQNIRVPINSASYPSTYTWASGASISLILPYLRGSWVIYNDLTYKPYKIIGAQIEETITTYPITQREFIFNVAYLKLNTLIRYHYPNWKIRPFVNVGMSNSYALKLETKEVTTVIRNEVPTITETDIFRNPRKYEMGLLIGGGVTYRWFGLEIRYELANGMSNVNYISTTDSSLLFLFSFTF